MEFDDLNQSLGVFESALSSMRLEIKDVALARVLVALDGSNQDSTSIELARTLAGTRDIQLFVAHGTNGEPGKAEKARVEAAIAALGTDSAQPVEVSGTDPARQLLSAARRVDAHLIIAPAPYLRDIDTLEDESLSSPIDVLLAESQIPLLLVRQPMSEVSRCFGRIVLPLSVHVAESAGAAGWAFALLAAGGHIELHAVADEAELKENIELVHGVTRPLDKGELLRAEERHVGSIIAALQKRGAELGARIEAEVEVGRAHRRLIEHIHASPSVAVVGLPLERQDDSFHFAVDLALGSRHPLLVVPPAGRASERSR